MAHTAKNLPAVQEDWVRSQSRKDPLDKGMATTPVFLPGEAQGRGSLVGCRLWGRTESDSTEATQQQQQLLESAAVTVPWKCETGIGRLSNRGTGV